jgi:His/Glu/Gln/Arg/opine family amino acid ABC transporter permease subunit
MGICVTPGSFFTWRPPINFGHIGGDLSALRGGIYFTLVLTALSFLVASTFGLVLALARSSRRRLVSAPATLYINVFLSTPILVQLLWIYYVLPQNYGILLSDLQVLVLALGLHTAASMAEVYRGGLLAVDPGQRDGARVLGLTSIQSLRFVILPQAIRLMIPALVSSVIGLLKDSSLATFIGANDLLNSGRSLAIDTFRPIEVFTVVALAYFVLTYPISLAGSYLERRLSYS